MSSSSYQIEKLPGEPIVAIKIFEHFDFRNDAETCLTDTQAVFDSVGEPFHYIVFIEDISLSFGDVVSALSMVTRGDLAVVRHPDMKKLYMAAASNLITMATRALGQTQYGGIQAMVVESFDEGVERARAELNLLAS